MKNFKHIKVETSVVNPYVPISYPLIRCLLCTRYLIYWVLGTHHVPIT